jgi:hypothetical protein
MPSDVLANWGFSKPSTAFVRSKDEQLHAVSCMQNKRAGNHLICWQMDRISSCLSRKPAS